MTSAPVWRVLAGAACIVLCPTPLSAQTASLTILHNNDGESQLLNESSAGTQFGGAARFVTAVRTARKVKSDRDVLTISSGDHFLASPELNATLQTLSDDNPGDGTFFDARVLDAIGYDAIVLGNHDFDFGPEFLADFIERLPSTPFLSANVIFTGEPRLRALVVSGRLAKSAVVTKGNNNDGIIGVTTEELAHLSSPGNVSVLDAAASVIFKVKKLRGEGINKIIVASHLQSVQRDVVVLQELHRLGQSDPAFDLQEVDVVIAGGGGELLLNETDSLNDATGANGPYPIRMRQGEYTTPIVTTPGSYHYLGVVDVEFDEHGIVTFIGARNEQISTGPGANPVLIDGSFHHDDALNEAVVEPIRASIAGLKERVVSISEVPLDGRRATIRTRETNLGNLVADSFAFAATNLRPDLFGTRAVIALANGGGIRNNGIIEPGPITEFHTFETLPFANFLAVFENVNAGQVKALMEHALALVEQGRGQFAQISGFEVHFDANREPGDRVRHIVAAGRPVVADGQVVSEETVDLVTIDFLALDGDGYPFRELGMHFTIIPVSYQQALLAYPGDPKGRNGVITTARYGPSLARRLIPLRP